MPRQPRAPRKPRSPREPRAPREQQATARQPQPGQVVAKFGGTCASCGRSYAKGQPIKKTGEGWGHPACAEATGERGRILAGETFRAQAGSTWRRGQSPGSSRSRY